MRKMVYFVNMEVIETCGTIFAIPESGNIVQILNNSKTSQNLIFLVFLLYQEYYMDFKEESY